MTPSLTFLLGVQKKEKGWIMDTGEFYLRTQLLTFEAPDCLYNWGSILTKTTTFQLLELQFHPYYNEIIKKIFLTNLNSIIRFLYIFIIYIKKFCKILSRTCDNITNCIF